MNVLGKAIEVNIGSNLDYLDLVEAVTDKIAKMVGFDEDMAYWITMAVHEGVANAILHGNRLQDAKRVNVRFEINPDGITISVQDEGSGFDVDSLPDPLDPSNILKPGGRGIFYIRTFMDEVEFRRLARGMEIRMRKRLNPKSGDKV